MIVKAIDSVLAQTYENWELIIINDASTDNTDEIVANYNDERIVYLKNEKNLERSASRNKGIDIAKGDFICFLDSDDFYLENHLEEFEKCIIDNSNKEVVYYAETYVDNGDILEKCTPNHVEINKLSYLERVLVSPIGVPRLCIAKTLFKNETFNIDIKIGEDIDLLVRLINMGVALIPNNKYTLAYLEHQNRTYSKDNIEVLLLHINLINNILKENKHSISSNIYKKIKSNNYFYLARAYQNNRILRILYLIKSISYSPKNRLKEKIYMMIK